MNWILLIFGIILVWFAIQIVRLQSLRKDLPGSIQDKMLFGDRPVTKDERTYVQRYGLYGARSSHLAGALIALTGVGLIIFALSGP